MEDLGAPGDVPLGFLSVPPREQVSACVSILERLLQALDPLYVIQNLREELQKGLFHPDDSVKILTISQVELFLQDERQSSVLSQAGLVLVCYC